MRARVTGKDAEVSDWSNPRLLRSVVTGVRLGGATIKYVTIAAVSLLFLAVVFGIFAYFLLKVRKLRRELFGKEMKEAKASVEEGFAEIRKDLIEELRLIEVGAQGGKLSTSQLERKEHILREIHNIEKNIEKELGDVEKLRD